VVGCHCCERYENQTELPFATLGGLRTWRRFNFTTMLSRNNILPLSSKQQAIAKGLCALQVASAHRHPSHLQRG